MIKSYLTNKRVSWNELHRISESGKPDYVRKTLYGKVVDVTTCNNLACVLDDKGVYHEIETSELEIISE